MNEECDDGNEVDGDGCGALDCTIEPMFECNNKIPNFCWKQCGNGILNKTAGEQCDDGNQ